MGITSAPSTVRVDARGRPRIRSLVGHHGMSALERKVAMYRAAGASQESIAFLLETAQANISQILARPHVADLVVMLTVTACEGLEEPINNLNAQIEHVAQEAFSIEVSNMRELDAMADEASLADRPVARIKAKVSATAIAQDILDRAGKRAPTRVVQTHVGMRISDEQVSRLTRVAEELTGTVIDVTPKPEEE